MHHWRSSAADEESRSSRKGKKFRRADTNIVSIKFNKLIAPSNMHTGDPVSCSKCGSFLSHISSLQHEDTLKIWSCDFCSERNAVDLDEEEKPAAADVTFMLEPAMATTSSGPSGLDESLVVFCVDISGSMCVTSEVPGNIRLRGTDRLRRLQSFNDLEEDQYLPRQSRDTTYVSRMQAVQAAVDHQLEEMLKTYPHRRVALVSFSNEVTVIGDGTTDPVTIAGDKLTQKEALYAAGAAVDFPKHIKDTRNNLALKLFQLEEGGPTALGPALIVAISMAAKCRGSKVIICTDGKANVGLGKLEDQGNGKAGEDSEDFYAQIGESAAEKGVAVSVVSIKGTDCKLVDLGNVAEKTGGQVNIVDPLKLTAEFSNILADHIIATNVVATFIIHKGLYFRNEDNQSSRAERIVGNVTADTEITFEYGVHDDYKKKKKENAAAVSGKGASSSSAEKSEENLSELPFQLQIKYTDADGTKALRVLTQTKPITSVREVAEKDMNFTLVGMHAAQTSAQQVRQGQYTIARSGMMMNQRLAWRNANSKSTKQKYRAMFDRVEAYDSAVNNLQKRERRERGRSYSDSGSDDDDDECMAATGDNRSMSCIEPPPMLSKSKAKKKMKQRSSECPDRVAKMTYGMLKTSSTTVENARSDSD